MGIQPWRAGERLGAADLTPPFKNVSVIRDGELELRLADKYFSAESRVPCYEFSISVGGEEVGTYHVRVENDFEKVRQVGNVGIEINRKFPGEDLPARATTAILPLLREHGVNSILITQDKGKRATRRACELLGARYKDTIDLPELGIERERFTLDF